MNLTLDNTSTTYQYQPHPDESTHCIYIVWLYEPRTLDNTSTRFHTHTDESLDHVTFDRQRLVFKVISRVDRLFSFKNNVKDGICKYSGFRLVVSLSLLLLSLLLAIPPCYPSLLSLLLTFSPIADPLFLPSSITVLFLLLTFHYSCRFRYSCCFVILAVSLFLPFRYSCRFVIPFLIDSKCITTGSTYIRRFGRRNVGPDNEYILGIKEALL